MFYHHHRDATAQWFTLCVPSTTTNLNHFIFKSSTYHTTTTTLLRLPQTATHHHHHHHRHHHRREESVAEEVCIKWVCYLLDPGSACGLLNGKPKDVLACVMAAYTPAIYSFSPPPHPPSRSLPSYSASSPLHPSTRALIFVNGVIQNQLTNSSSEISPDREKKEEKHTHTSFRQFCAATRVL